MTGIVLAGGQSRRMGTPKHELVIDGETLLARSVRVLTAHCQRVYVASGSVAIPGYDCVLDRVPGAGPLAGLDAGLRAADGDDVFLLACDFPRITSKALEPLMTSSAAVVVPVIDSHRQPLAAFYSHSVHSVVVEQLNQGRYAMWQLLERVPMQEVIPPDPAAFWNINTPADWMQKQSHTDNPITEHV